MSEVEVVPDIRPNIKKAKLKIMTKKGTVFFSALLSGLKILIGTDKVPTAGTDGVHLALNPHFVSKLPLDQLIFLLLHEVWHVLLQHPSRCEEMGLDKKLYNCAGDFYINGRLDLMGFEMPSGGLLDHRFDGMSTMQIYDQLKQENFLSPQNMMNDLLAGAGVLSDKDPDELKARAKANIMKAATAAQAANEWGSVPADIRREVEKMMNPLLPWNLIFQNYMTEYAREDYTNARPNRRYWPDWFLPTLRNPSLGHVFHSIDVSGSMHQKLLDQIHSEIAYAWDNLKPDGMRIVGFDTQIHDVLDFEPGDLIENVTLHGGGGTELQPIIDMIQEYNPRFATIFTDGYFAMPDMSGLTTDLFWIVFGNENFNPPYGTVIPAEISR